MASLILKPGLKSALLLSATIQASAYLFSTVNRPIPTEIYYDLSGSLTHLALAAQALYVATGTVSSSHYPSISFNPRVTLLASLSVTWSIRLGWYLYNRVHRVGKDDRFDQLKKDPIRWTFPWVFQTLWCFTLQAPLTLVAANSLVHPSLTNRDTLGLLVFIAGFAWETLADYQKSSWKFSHPNDPITWGLFKYSVYANYFGECSLWWGAYLLAAPALTSLSQHILALSAPLFTNFLLHFVSGIPLLEKSVWRKYGNRPAYLDYRARTSTFFPFPPKKSINSTDMDQVKLLAMDKSKDTCAQ